MAGVWIAATNVWQKVVSPVWLAGTCWQNYFSYHSFVQQINRLKKLMPKITELCILKGIHGFIASACFFTKKEIKRSRRLLELHSCRQLLVTLAARVWGDRPDAQGSMLPVRGGHIWLRGTSVACHRWCGGEKARHTFDKEKLW